MKTTTLKGQIRAVEREIAVINSTIDQKKKELGRMERGVHTQVVYIEDFTKEVLAKFILDGAKLIADYAGNVFFYQEYQETEDEFNKRINCQNKSIAGLEAKKEQLKVSLEDLKELKRQEDAIYKNPEYIQYLKLKGKFEKEDTLCK